MAELPIKFNVDAACEEFLQEKARLIWEFPWRLVSSILQQQQAIEQWENEGGCAN